MPWRSHVLGAGSRRRVARVRRASRRLSYEIKAQFNGCRHSVAAGLVLCGFGAPCARPGSFFAGPVRHAHGRARSLRVWCTMPRAGLVLCGSGAPCPRPGSGCAGPLRGLPCGCWSRRAATFSVALFPGGPGAILGGEIRPAGGMRRPARKEQGKIKPRPTIDADGALFCRDSAISPA